MLWEILGLGSGSMPLTFRFSPPIGGCLYWLRPGTVRLPPWPDKVPLTAGNTAHDRRRRPLRRRARRPGLPAADRRRGRAGTEPGGSTPPRSASCSACSALLGLRDKVSFLAARPEVYGPPDAGLLFPLENLIVGWQLVFICIWWGAASVEAQPPLPLRDRGDDLQHALEPLAQDEGEALPD